MSEKTVEQVFFNVPLSRLEPIFKRWIKEVNEELVKEKTQQPDKFLSIQEAAKFLSLSVPTMYTKVSTGKLPYMKRGKRLYFSESELIEYLKSGRRKS